MNPSKPSLFAIASAGLLAATTILAAENEPTPEVQAAPTPAELIATRCLICHGNPAEGTKRLAPPFRMVKMHYDNLDEDAFVKAVTAWVKQPDKAKSKMPGAIRNFGLMPPQPLPEEEIVAIARYLHQTDFAMPGRGGRMGGGPPWMRSGNKAAGETSTTKQEAGCGGDCAESCSGSCGDCGSAKQGTGVTDACGPDAKAGTDGCDIPEEKPTPAGQPDCATPESPAQPPTR